MDSRRLLSQTKVLTSSTTPSLAEDARVASKLLKNLNISEEPKALLRKIAVYQLLKFLQLLSFARRPNDRCCGGSDYCNQAQVINSNKDGGIN